jgi:hypothetical protein
VSYGIKYVTIKRLIDFNTGDSVIFIYSHDVRVTTSASFGLDGFSGYFERWYPTTITKTGWHLAKGVAKKDYKSLQIGVIIPSWWLEKDLMGPVMYKDYPMFLYFTSISVKRVGSSIWEEISGFVPPNTPYADKKDLTTVTTDFMQAVVDTAIRGLRWGADTKVFYSLVGEHGFRNGDKIVLLSQGNSATGIIQFSEMKKIAGIPEATGIIQETKMGSPLELSVVWPGQFNGKDLTDLRAYKINKPTEVAMSPAAPTDFTLGQNYPNPFNPATTIPFNLAKNGDVELTIYNLRGQLVKNLVTGYQPSGQHQVVWNGHDENGEIVPTGVYFVRLATNGQAVAKKLNLIK